MGEKHYYYYRAARHCGNSEIKKNFIQVEKKSVHLCFLPLQAEVWIFFFLWLRLPFRTVVERRALALKEDFSMCKALFRSGIPCKKQKCSLPSRQTDCSNKIGIVTGSRKVWILVSLPTKPKYLEQCLAPNRCSADAQWTKQDKY